MQVLPNKRQEEQSWSEIVYENDFVFSDAKINTLCGLWEIIYDVLKNSFVIFGHATNN